VLSQVTLTQPREGYGPGTAPHRACERGLGLLVKGTCTWAMLLPWQPEHSPWLAPFVSVDIGYASVPLQSNFILCSEAERHLAGLFSAFSSPSSTTSQGLGSLRKEGMPMAAGSSQRASKADTFQYFSSTTALPGFWIYQYPWPFTYSILFNSFWWRSGRMLRSRCVTATSTSGTSASCVEGTPSLG